MNVECGSLLPLPDAADAIVVAMCTACRHAKPITFDEVAIGYFSCTWQVHWQYRVQCNINRYEAKP